MQAKTVTCADSQNGASWKDGGEVSKQVRVEKKGFRSKSMWTEPHLYWGMFVREEEDEEEEREGREGCEARLVLAKSWMMRELSFAIASSRGVSPSLSRREGLAPC
jgi:hypothetical protein